MQQGERDKTPSFSKIKIKKTLFCLADGLISILFFTKKYKHASFLFQNIKYHIFRIRDLTFQQDKKCLNI